MSSIPDLLFQFLSQFYITRYDMGSIISDFASLRSFTLFVLPIASIFNTDVF